MNALVLHQQPKTITKKYHPKTQLLSIHGELNYGNESHAAYSSVILRQDSVPNDTKTSTLAAF